jgi:hypothetical protein
MEGLGILRHREDYSYRNRNKQSNDAEATAARTRTIQLRTGTGCRSYGGRRLWPSSTRTLRTGACPAALSWLRGMRASPLCMAGVAVELPCSLLPRAKRSPGMGELLRAARTGVAQVCRPTRYWPPNVASSLGFRTKEQQPDCEHDRGNNSSDQFGGELH